MSLEGEEGQNRDCSSRSHTLPRSLPISSETISWFEIQELLDFCIAMTAPTNLSSEQALSLLWSETTSNMYRSGIRTLLATLKVMHEAE